MIAWASTLNDQPKYQPRRNRARADSRQPLAVSLQEELPELRLVSFDDQLRPLATFDFSARECRKVLTIMQYGAE